MSPAQGGHNKSQQKEKQGACATYDGNVLEVRLMTSFYLKRNKYEEQKPVTKPVRLEKS